MEVVIRWLYSEYGGGYIANMQGALSRRDPRLNATSSTPHVHLPVLLTNPPRPYLSPPITLPASPAGTDPRNQLEQIVRVLGAPAEDDLASIMNEGALQFIASLPPSTGYLDKVLANASPQAFDLVRRLFCFTPTNRLTAIEALQHPYVASHYDSKVEAASNSAKETVRHALNADGAVLDPLTRDTAITCTLVSIVPTPPAPPAPSPPRR